MRILTQWLRSYLPELAVDDRRLAEDLTLRGIAVEGIFDLDARPGGAGNGSLFEMDITTNRVDAMNHYGVAREAAAIYGVELKPLDLELPAAAPGTPFAVEIEARDLCGRFTARVLEGITVGASSGELARYFTLLEQKFISSAVDATSYAWLAMGQPTHAFDLDRIEGGIRGGVLVRRARRGERLRLLDETERVLDPEDLVVADARGPLALAGVMGGWESRITAGTRNVLVEAAWFDPAAVRQSARRHGLHTDASHRFERGADFAAAPAASALVSRLILERGGALTGPLTDVIVPELEARTAGRAPVYLRLPRLQQLLGPTQEGDAVPAEAAARVLSALGCRPRPEGDGFEVSLPSWRLDLASEIDMVEEVARIYGYNRFRNTLPAFAGRVEPLPEAAKQAMLRSLLLAEGLHEAISGTFCAATDAALFAPRPGATVAIENPLSEQAGVLRPSLLPGMLAMMAANLNRDIPDVRLFEMGTVFSGTAEQVEERPALALGLTGRRGEEGPFAPAAELGFYDLKGILEQLLGGFAARSLYFDSFAPGSGLMPAWLHPYRCARAVLEGATVGYFGELHPQQAARLKLRQRVLIGELALDRIYRHALRPPRVRELSRYPPVRRDFSLEVPENVTWAELAAALGRLSVPELLRCSPSEVYRPPAGEGGSSGRGYSLLLSVIFQSEQRTLREEEVKLWSEQVLEAVGEVGARLRQ